jgi:hypothetical protein
MVKDEKEDMTHCEVSWSKNISCVLLKCGIEIQGDGSYIKQKKTSKTTTHLDFWDKNKKENEKMKYDDGFKPAATQVAMPSWLRKQVRHL